MDILQHEQIVSDKLQGVIRNPFAFYFLIQGGFGGPIQTLPLQHPSAGWVSEGCGQFNKHMPCRVNSGSKKENTSPQTEKKSPIRRKRGLLQGLYERRKAMVVCRRASQIYMEKYGITFKPNKAMYLLQWHGPN